MKSFPLILLLCLGLLPLHAAPYSERGMKSYIKLCKRCHGGPFKGAGMKKSDEWKQFFSSPSSMNDVHKNDAGAMEKISSSLYEKRIDDIKAFLIQNAKDMGAVPGCDANYCGN